MKKGILILILCLVIIIPFYLLIPKGKYDIIKFSVECEPDGVFVSKFSDDLFVIVGDNIRKYDKNSDYNTLDIDISVSSIFPYKESLWVIDQNNDLYRYSSDKRVLVLSDIVDFSVGNESYAAISKSGELYVWGENAYRMLGANEAYIIETPVLVDKICNAKKVEIGNHNVLLLDKKAQLYECLMLENESQYNAFEKIEGLESIQEIYSGYGNIAVAESGKTYYWFNSFFSDYNEPYLDDLSIIEKRCDELCVENYSLSSKFCVGCTEQGEIYWWGADIFRKSYNKSIRAARLPTLIGYIQNAENVYSGFSTIYVKSDLDFYIVRSTI